MLVSLHVLLVSLNKNKEKRGTSFAFFRLLKNVAHFCASRGFSLDEILVSTGNFDGISPVVILQSYGCLFLQSNIVWNYF